MRKLNRLLLTHWYSYDREVIEFGTINFLTGKTAAGKSTIIDALQLVLLGDTNGNFFNKAANEKSVRTLKSYLYGENGDDGDTGFRYLRKGPFTSYVVAEFEDTERKTFFLNGIVCDCFSDQNISYKWFTADKMKLPAHLFVDEKTNVPFNIAKLKNFLKQNAKNRYEMIDTNRRYQEIVLARYGSVKRKYLTLLKKAVPFSPITDIEKFITESVCDVKNNIQVEQMQSDIRQYKSLEADALRTEARIHALKEIAGLTDRYENAKELYRQQSYIVQRAEEEEYREALQKILAESDARQALIEETEEKAGRLIVKMDALAEEIEKLETEYHTSDIVQKHKSLEAQIEEKTREIKSLENQLETVLDKLSMYEEEWRLQIADIKSIGFTVSEDIETALQLLAEIVKDKSGKKPAFPAEEKTGLSFIAEAMEKEKERLGQFVFELRQRTAQLKNEIIETETRIQGLKKGIKPYPASVMALKTKLETELFRSCKKAVEIPVFADLLEIKDPSWADAIEGYLDRQKFNLIVPEAYFSLAAEIYHQVRKEEKIYDAGLVDIGKLRKDRLVKPEAGSLADEIETKHPDARLYADYLLGRVMKCENVKEIARYPVSITRSVMLYKGYVVRKLNPVRYRDPFIGRRSLEIQIERLSKQLHCLNQENDERRRDLRIAERAASCSSMSRFEAQQHETVFRNGQNLETLRQELAGLKKEYEELDFTYLNRMKAVIDEKKQTEQEDRQQLTALAVEKAKAQEQIRQMQEQEIPRIEALAASVKERIQKQFEETWVEANGEPVFCKELQKEGRTRLSLRESFERAGVRTATIMEGHLKERRRLRAEYNQTYLMPYDIEREDNDEYDKEYHVLNDIRLPEYIDKIIDAKEKAYNQFRDDFIAKLKSNIEAVRDQIAELNNSLKNSVFGTDRYRFTMSPRAEYRNYYDMITDPILMDTGGWNIASDNFNRKYQKEIDSLFKALIINETDVSAERRAEYEKSIKKFTDYKTYLVFDLIVTNEQGEEQRLSRTLLKKSGGETQIPFYISLLASFSQICRIRSKTNHNTIRIIILDEAFSKMDGERIRESVQLLRKFGLQAIFSAPPDKIPDIAPIADRNIAVFKTGSRSFTRHFDPAEIEAVEENLG